MIDPSTILQFLLAGVTVLIGREGIVLVRAKFGNGHGGNGKHIPLTVIVSTETDRGVREVRAIVAGATEPLGNDLSHLGELMTRLVALTEVLVGQGRTHK